MHKRVRNRVSKNSGLSGIRPEQVHVRLHLLLSNLGPVTSSLLMTSFLLLGNGNNDNYLVVTFWVWNEIAYGTVNTIQDSSKAPVHIVVLLTATEKENENLCRTWEGEAVWILTPSCF